MYERVHFACGKNEFRRFKAHLLRCHVAQLGEEVIGEERSIDLGPRPIRAAAAEAVYRIRLRLYAIEVGEDV